MLIVASGVESESGDEIYSNVSRQRNDTSELGAGGLSKSNFLITCCDQMYYELSIKRAMLYG